MVKLPNRHCRNSRKHPPHIYLFGPVPVYCIGTGFFPGANPQTGRKKKK